MRRPKLWWVLAGLALGALLSVVFAVWPRPDRVTRENFRLIQVGMDQAEVRAILRPSGDYTTAETALADDAPLDDILVGTEQPEPFGERDEWWVCDRVHIGVKYDTRGRVLYAVDFRARPIDRGPLDHLLWRAKRQWRKWFPEKPEVP